MIEDESKLVIVAFDGLEYHLTWRFKLKALRQLECGKLTIPRECYVQTVDPHGFKIYEPWTPYVFATFLTGQLPRETGLNKITYKKWGNPLLDSLRKITIKLHLDKIKEKGKFLRLIGFKYKVFNLKEAGHKTIFDYAENPVVINVPTYSPEWDIEIFGDKGSSFEEVAQSYWRSFHRTKKETLSKLRARNFDLLMSYTRLLDIIGELYYCNFQKLYKAYFECNKYIDEVTRLIKPDDLLIVMSDHGVQRYGETPFGCHSDHAFYSTNKPFNKIIQSIIDLNRLVKNYLMRKT